MDEGDHGSRVQATTQSATSEIVQPDVAREQNETSPLLPNTSSANASEDSNARSFFILLIICSLMVLLDFGGYLNIAPQTDIFQDILCRKYYQDNEGSGRLIALPSREMCKIEPIQSELAIINGWKDTFDQIPGILLALPYGILADRIGRKPVLLLGMAGLNISDVWIKVVCWWPSIFPLRAVWLSSISQVIGGGAQVATSMFFVILTDAFNAEDRANAYFRLSAAVLISEMAATPLSAALMSKNPWIPFILSSIIQFIGFLLAFSIPETLSIDKQTQRNPMQAEEAEASQNSKTNSLRSRLLGLFQDGSKKDRSKWMGSNVQLLLFAFFVTTLSKQSMQLLLQYVSKRYNWSFAQASFLLSLRAIVNLVLLLVLLPSITAILIQRYQTGAARKDLLLLKGSGSLLTGGALVMGLAGSPILLVAGLVLFALGSAFHLTARSLAASLVPATARGTLFTAIAVISAAGQLVAGPILANTFRGGMKLGGAAIGLPFLVAGLLYLFSTFAVSFIRLQSISEDAAEAEDRS